MSIFHSEEKHEEMEHKMFMAMRKLVSEKRDFKKIDAADKIAKKCGYGDRIEMMRYAELANRLACVLSESKAGGYKAEKEEQYNPDLFKNTLEKQYSNEKHELSVKITGYKADADPEEETEYWIHFTLQGALIYNGVEYHFIIGKNDKDKYVSGAQHFDMSDNPYEILDCLAYASYRRGILNAFNTEEDKHTGISEVDAVVHGILGLFLREGYLSNKFLALFEEKANDAADGAQSSWDSSSDYDDL